ncbi:SGNH/GDSL hydrolase family protein [Leuconostoc mesenteroides]|uniref:SGNH/GDSL hydrolase family protein n=1 Tax=Leuconostoc mesenteroides TaxID=1245 RepID=UPI0023625B25|nr:SGNH/GDSL hydrolase family protein [Leuconostoc mesenteroides]
MDRLKTNELSLGLDQGFRGDLIDNFEKIQKGVDGQSDSLNKQILDMLGNVAPQDQNEVTQARIDGNGKAYDTLKGREDATQATAETALSEERDTSVEVQAARTNSSSQTYPTLKERMDSQENDLNNSINDKLAQISVIPETFANLGALQSKYPTGKPGIFVVADTGHKYIWVNGTWVDSGVYQAVGLADGIEEDVENHNKFLTTNFIATASDLDLDSNYKDFDLVPVNSVVTYAYIGAEVLHQPGDSNTDGGTLITRTYSNLPGTGGGTVQTFFMNTGKVFTRIKWGNPATFKPWAEITNGNLDEINKSVDGINKFLTRKFISKATDLDSAYTDFDLVPANSVVTYAYIGSEVLNQPSDSTTDGGTLVTQTYTNSPGTGGGSVQTFTRNTGRSFTRIKWGNPATYNQWMETTKNDYRETTMSLFETISVVGDSFARGTIGNNGKYYTNDDISWPTMISRRNGIKYLNIAKGGITTRDYLTDPDCLPKLNLSEPSDLYVLILGINDAAKLGTGYLGTIDDIKTDSVQNADTFYGNYGKIISAIKTKSPNAIIFMFDTPFKGSVNDSFNEAAKNIANHFALPFISHSSMPLFSSSYFTGNLSLGHPIAPLYAAMSVVYENAISRYFQSNPLVLKQFKFSSDNLVNTTSGTALTLSGTGISNEVSSMQYDVSRDIFGKVVKIDYDVIIDSEMKDSSDIGIQFINGYPEWTFSKLAGKHFRGVYHVSDKILYPTDTDTTKPLKIRAVTNNFVGKVTVTNVVIKRAM